MRLKHFLFLACVFITFSAQAEELWVGSYFGDNAKRYDLASGALLGTVGTGKLDGTLGMSLDKMGSVYIASELTGSIEKFDQAGTWQSRFAIADSPTGLAFGSNGKAYVAQFNSDSVSQYTSTGSALGTFVSNGSGGLDGPDLGITFGPDGNLYVPSFYSGDVLRYDGVTGTFIDKFVPAGSGGLTQPRQIVWHNGSVFVTSDNGNKVLRYDGNTGAFLGTFVTAGSGGLSGATGMVFSGDSLYIASTRNNRVLRYNASTGAFIGSFVTAGLSGPVSLLVVPEPSCLITLCAVFGIFLMGRATIRS